MDHIGILKQALHTTVRNPALWILGFIWALVGGGGGYYGIPSNAENSVNYQLDSNEFMGFSEPFINPVGILSVIVLLCCVMFFIIALLMVVNYVLRAGVARVIHAHDTDNEKPTVRRGFSEGWNRRTWRLFFQDLIIWFPFALIAMLTLLLVASPLLLLAADNDFATAIAIIGTVGLFIGWLAVVIISATLLGVLSHFWWRAAAIGDQTTGVAIRSAWRLVRNNFGDVAIMWLLMMGIGILLAMLMIPIVLVILLLASVVAVAPAMLIFTATESLLGAFLWGIPVGILLIIVPISFVSGLIIIFRTAVWNQVYDQLVERSGLASAH